MKALVTGGGGFLGGAIVRMLVGRGDEVVTFHRGEYAWLGELGVEVCRGDLCDGDAVARAASGCDVVFHVAAKAGVWGKYDDYYRANVEGTRNVIDACRSGGVKCLVYTSSPSVVFDGSDEEGIDESVDYPAKYLSHYSATKAEAERLILAANCGGLVTVAIRPHLIWGEGDPHLVPRIIERGKAGRLRLVGDEEKLVDSTYIENAAAAHVCAADKLTASGSDEGGEGDDGGRGIGGKVYFISNGEPMVMSELINAILEAGGAAVVTKRISARAAYGVGAVLEWVYGMFGVKSEPMLTRFVARQLATAHWFDISAARRDLGYEPKVSIDEGMRRLKVYLAGDKK